MLIYIYYLNSVVNRMISKQNLLFQDPFTTSVGYETDPNATTYVNKCKLRELEKVHRTSLKLSYVLNQEQASIMQELLETRHAVYKDQPDYNSHPVAANLQGIAYQRCIEMALKFGNRAIDIGGSYYRTPEHHHICTYAPGIREDGRYTFATLQGINNHLAEYHTEIHETGCTSGAQYCHYATKYGYMINVYDISMKTIADIMVNHSMEVLDVWMFLPLMLLDECMTIDQKYYNCQKHPDDNDKIIFSLNDQSNVYIHDYETWRQYLTTVAVIAPNGAINVEIVEQFGTFTNIRFIRTWKNQCNTMRKIPISKYMADFVMFPRVTAYLNEGSWMENHATDEVHKYEEKKEIGKLKQFLTGLPVVSDIKKIVDNVKNQHKNVKNGNIYEKYYVVDKRYVTKVRNHANSLKKDQFTYEGVMAYANSQKNDVSYEQSNHLVLVHTGAKISTNVYNKLILDIFTLVAIDRFVRTQTIKNNLETLHEWDDFLPGLDRICSKFVSYFKDRKACREHVETQKFSDEIYNLRPIEFKDMLVSGIVLHNNIPPIVRPYTRKGVYYKHVGKETATIAPEKALTPPSMAPHGKIVSVPGDGKCGIHALEYYDSNINEKKDNPERYKKGWYGADELANICDRYKYNLIVHLNQSPKHYYNFQHKNTITLNYTGSNDRGHWTPLICDCKINMFNDVSSASGFYKDIPVAPGYLYVNCANDQYLDKAGQAKDFRAMFPNYDKGRKMKKTIDCYSIKQNGKDIHIAVAVAYNNVDGDIGKVKKTLAQICKEIDDYACLHNLVVLMPMIGGNIFNNPKCCIKSAIETMRCRMIKRYINPKEMQLYNNTAPCTHGGYLELGVTTANIICSDKPSINWKNIMAQKDSTMQQKLDDIIDYVKHVLKTDVGIILETSCAPGGFLRNEKYHIYGLHYSADDPMAKDLKPLGSYSTTKGYNKLLLDLLKTECKFDIIITDIPNTAVDYKKHIASSYEYAKRVGARAYVFKVQHNIGLEFKNEFDSYDVHVFANSHSKTTSGEMYMLVHIGVTTADNKTLDLADCVKIKDDHIFEQQKNAIHDCEHNINFTENAKATAKVCPKRLNALCQELQKDDALNADVKEFLSKLAIEDDISVTISCDIGVGGAGKTMGIARSTCTQCTIMASPYRANTDDINTTMGSKYANTYVTILNNIIYRNDYKNFVIDELFAHNMTMVALYTIICKNSKFYGTGDEKQLKAVDWDGTNTAPTIKYTSPYRTVTRRNPQSVINLFEKYIPGIKTLNEIKTKVIWHDDPEEIYKIKKTKLNEIIICFTHNMADYIAKKVKDVNIRTAAQAHGKTYEQVHLVMTDLKGLPESARFEHFYTAAGRTSRQLILYGTKEDLDIIVLTSGWPIERALALNDITMIEGPNIKEKPLAVEIKGDQQIRIKIPPVNTYTVCEILERFLNKFNDLPPHVIDINYAYIPQIKSEKKFKAPLDAILPVTQSIVAKRMTQTNYNKLYNSSNTVQVTKTLIGRYGNRVRKFALDKTYEDRFFTAIKKWLKPDFEMIARNKPPTRELIWKHTVEALKNMQHKFPKEYDDAFKDIGDELIEVDDNAGESAVNAYHAMLINDTAIPIDKDGKTKRVKLILQFIDLLLDPNATPNKYQEMETEFDNTYHFGVSFHMKAQPKMILKNGWDVKDKAGQGVSAWTKIANIVNAGFMRYFDELLPQIVRDNVQISYNASDKDLSVFWLRYAPQINDPKVIKFANDFGEFDSTQEERGIKAIVHLYKIVGVSKFTQNFMLRMRSNWEMCCYIRGKVYSQPMVLAGKWQQHSGQIHTLGSNTLYNMGALGMCFDFSDYYCAAFKGDDSAVLCNSFKEVVNMGAPIHKTAGFKFKIETPIVMEYIANIITPFGFVPDLIRRVSRVVSKVYNTKADWKEIRKSTDDSLSVVNEENLALAMGWLRKFYLGKGIDITADELEAMYFFLRNVVTDDTLEPSELEDLDFLTIY